MTIEARPNRFDSLEKRREVPPQAERGANRFDALLKGRELPAPEESGLKSAARTALQVPLGIAKKSPISYVPDIFKGLVNATAENELREFASEHPDLGIDVNEALKTVHKQSEYLPTQDLLERVIEEKTGLPLQPKSKLDKALRLGSTAGTLRPGGAVAKGTAAVVAPSTSGILHAMGVPEPLAEGAGLLASGLAPTPKVSTVTKPSGLKTRNFEKTKAEPKFLQLVKRQLKALWKRISKEFPKKS